MIAKCRRTPKFAVTKRGQEWRSNKYLKPKNAQPMVETAMGLYFIFPEWVALENGLWFSLPFLVLFQVGYLYVGLSSLALGRRGRRVGTHSVDPAAAAG